MICKNSMQHIAQYPRIHRRFEFRPKAFLVMCPLKGQINLPFFSVRIEGVPLLQRIIAPDLVQYVLPLATNAQILPLVVERIMVNVIDHFCTGQGSAQHAPTNEAMQERVGPLAARGAEEHMPCGQNATGGEPLTDIRVTVINKRNNDLFLIDEQFLHAGIIPGYNTWSNYGASHVQL